MKTMERFKKFIFSALLGLSIVTTGSLSVWAQEQGNEGALKSDEAIIENLEFLENLDYLGEDVELIKQLDEVNYEDQNNNN